MKRIMICRLSTITVFLLATLLANSVSTKAQVVSPADIPVEAFAALPSFSNPKLSPSGNFVGYLTSEDGHTLFMAVPLDGGPAVAIPPQPKSEIGTYYWINDTTVLLRLITITNRRVYGGKAVTETRLVVYNLKTQQAKWLGKPAKDTGLSSRGSESASQIERLLDKLPNDPDHILLQLSVQSSGIAAVYKVNINTGQRSAQKTGNAGVQRWYTDGASEVRLGLGYKGEKQVKYATLKDGNGKWNNLGKLDWYDKYDVVAFSRDPNIIYVSGPTQFGTEGFYTLNLATGQVAQTLFARENIDLESVYTDSITGQPIGFSYGGAQSGVEYFDPQYAALKASLDQAFPDTNNAVLSRSKSGRYLVKFSNSINPGTYYVFDQTAGRLSALANRQESIEPNHMSPVILVSIPVRDSSEISGYLTAPKPAQAGPGAFIMLPHGGPAGHDTASWDYWAQFYASRGYGVLQPNFRGSTGYGDAFMQAGEQQWGGLMQDDVTDATKWLINEGYADPERICIVGASYGGYAALMGTIKEPTLYRCAVSVNGVTNLPELKSADHRFLGGRNWVKTMGLTGVNDKEVSPFHRANEINVPVLLMSSVDDARIPWEMSQNMHKRLKKLKKDSKFVKIKDGTHNMVTAQSRLTMLKATEKFLAQHLGR